MGWRSLNSLLRSNLDTLPGTATTVHELTIHVIHLPQTKKENSSG